MHDEQYRRAEESYYGSSFGFADVLEGIIIMVVALVQIIAINIHRRFR